MHERFRNGRWVGAVALPVLLAACASGGGSAGGGAPAASRELVPVVAVERAGPLAAGDTASLDLAGVATALDAAAYARLREQAASRALQPGEALAGLWRSAPLPVFRGGRRIPGAVAAALGPRRGEAVVTASTLNLRSCRATRCTAVGRVAGGEVLRVDSLAEGWYRVQRGAGGSGYVAAEHLALPPLHREARYAVLRQATRLYYERSLQPRTAADEALFSGYQVLWERGGVHFQLRSAAKSAAARAAICRTTNDIRDYASYLLGSLGIDEPRSIAVWPEGASGAGAQAIARVGEGGRVICGS